MNGPIRDVIQAGSDWVTAETAFKRRAVPAEEACMKRKGYNYHAQALSPAQIKRDGLTSAYGTDLADTDFRRTQGYGVTSYLVGLVPDEAGAPSQIRGYTSMTPAEQKAADQASADCAVLSTKPWSTPAVETLLRAESDIGSDVHNDARVVAAAKAWSACMAEAGYAVTQYNDPINQLDARARPLIDAGSINTPEAKTLHHEELAMAARDWSCREKHVTAVQMAVRNEKELAYLERNPEIAQKVEAEMKAIIGR